MLAYGNNEGVLKIVFVDNAQGIVSSLKPFFKGESDMEILRQSCRRGVTSKNNSYHLGRGLYQVSNLAKNNNGSVSFFSEGAYYCLSSKKERMKKCGYWKGTIVIVDVNLSNPKALDSIPAFEINQKVRWV